MKNRFNPIFILLVLLALYGCGGSAEVERTLAQTAMGKAKDVHADSFAPSDFQKAQEAWDHGLIAEKEGRTGNAKVLFTSAKIFFGKAADIARSKHDALARELEAIQLAAGKNLAEVKIDLSMKALSARQRSQVEALVSEVEEANEAIKKLEAKDDLAKAVAAAKEMQTKVYHAQLVLAGRRIP